VLTDTTDWLQAPETSYYSIEWTLQAQESELYSMVSADGAMYAIRRELFVPFPADTILDDFAIPLNVVKAGRRVIFAETAAGWESGPSGLREEFNRKVRIAGGAAQALVRGWGWPVGARASVWFVFVSHKLLRWISPWVAAVALAIALLSAEAMLSRVVLVGAVLLLMAAGLRLIARKAHPLLDASFYFVMAQFAVALGTARGLTGSQSALWKKANR
jgi:cellulose synthase/poly-beta-1,6-N-acetylglucosamine synthase-like glycosyltransferase